jgi:hypothetical protein
LEKEINEKPKETGEEDKKDDFLLSQVAQILRAQMANLRFIGSIAVLDSKKRK